MNDTTKNLLYTAIQIYLASTQIFAFVFMVKYVKDDHSILEILFFGTITAEIQGLFWPFFI